VTVGIQVTQASVNAQIGSLALQMRNACRAGVEFQEWILTLGASGLEALGFSSADATTALNMASYLNTMGAVFFGTAAQTPAFNFDNALAGLYGGN